MAAGRISPPISRLLNATHLSAMKKEPSGICLLAVGEVFYRLISRTISIQMQPTFVDHLYPYQFGVATLGGCEMVVHGLRSTLEVHPNLVVLQVNIANAFNSLMSYNI